MTLFYYSTITPNVLGAMPDVYIHHTFGDSDHQVVGSRKDTHAVNYHHLGFGVVILISRFLIKDIWGPKVMVSGCGLQGLNPKP